MGIAVFTFAVVFLAQVPGVEVTKAVTAGAVDFSGMMFRLESLYITTAAFVLIQGASKVKWLKEHPAWAQFLPLAPAVLTVSGAFLPSFRLGAWDETLMYGLSLGAFIGWGHKLLKQTIFRNDSRIKGIDDPELQKLIDEYLEAKRRNTMSTKTKVKLRHHLEKLLT